VELANFANLGEKSSAIQSRSLSGKIAAALPHQANAPPKSFLKLTSAT
jgi:hypothetical protein